MENVFSYLFEIMDELNCRCVSVCAYSVKSKDHIFDH